MTTSYSQLVEYFQKVGRIQHAITFLQWDQLVMMPLGGNANRGHSIAELETILHELISSYECGELIQKAREQEDELILQRSLQEMERIHLHAACIPSDLVKAQSIAGSACEHGWRSYRQNNDWNSFLLQFKEVVELSRQEAMIRQEASSTRPSTPYDSLLELYCAGDSSETISSIFGILRKELPDLINKIMHHQNQPAPSQDIQFPIVDQERLSRKLMQILGFNFDNGRLDVSKHPFSTGDRGDQRITTRFRESEFLGALMATAHETGHASYEAGLPEKWSNLPIGDSRNMCIHESQSLLFEKQLFLSKPFLQYFTPHIHTFLPASKSLTCDSIRSSCLRVEPSYIRVEADEATYPLHVILRFEIEKELINGAIEAEHIPEIWDMKMQEYLGLSTAGNYTDGCLQDIHWTDGSFGYFPSYTVGAINAAQLFQSIKSAHQDWKSRIAQGDISFILQWLEEKIWSKGSSLDSQELMEKATGEKTNPLHFLNHLKKRYLENSE